MEMIEFNVWFTEMWLKSGGLISQSTAARMLNRTPGRISQMVKEKKFKLYQYENLQYLSFIEVREMSQKESFKKAREDLNELADFLPEEIANMFKRDQLNILDFAENPPEIMTGKTEE